MLNWHFAIYNTLAIIDMEPVQSEVERKFGQGAIPIKAELVINDGFDELDKEEAIKFFVGKNWQAVLQYLRGLKNKFSAAYYLEEWSVLSPLALAYYARAYLEFLFQTIESEDPDEPFISELLMAMYQVVYMHKGSPFTASETDIIKNVVSFIAEAATAKGISGYYDGDIKFGAVKFFNELQSHEG